MSRYDQASASPARTATTRSLIMLSSGGMAIRNGRRNSIRHLLAYPDSEGAVLPVVSSIYDGSPAFEAIRLIVAPNSDPVTTKIYLW